MNGSMMLVLLGITGGLMVMMLVVLVVVLRQGRRVERLAEETRELVEHAERHVEDTRQNAEEDQAPRE